MRTLCLLGLVLLLSFSSRHAAACSCSVASGAQSRPEFPWFEATDFPSNGLFTSSMDWRDASGRTLDLAADAALSTSLGFSVRRASGGMTEGESFFPVGSGCPDTGACRNVLQIGPADTTPPSAAELVDVTIVLADGAPETGASCQVDALVIEAAGTDDRTPRDELITVAFIGDTEADVAASETPAIGFAYDGRPGSRNLVSSITLGRAEGHQRDEGPLRQTGTFCFAVALMDWAGNIGARSATRCVDTRDATDPSTMLVPYAPPCSGAFCSASPGSRAAGGPLAIVLLAGVVVTARRRAARSRA